jgi:uncharacterized protein with NAD-binding domain and iron-sulfur cluster
MTDVELARITSDVAELILDVQHEMSYRDLTAQIAIFREQQTATNLEAEQAWSNFDRRYKL